MLPIEERIIKKILVFRNDRFGEFLLNIPALRALKETFPDALLIAAIDPYTKELAKGISFIDEIIEWGRKRHSFFEKIRLIRQLKKKKIDMAVMLNPSKDFNIITHFAGIPIRAGYDRKCGFLLTHKIKDRKYLGQKHEIEYNLELVSLVGAKTFDKTLSISSGNIVIDSLLKGAGIQDKDSLVALHPWTSDPVKQWPLEYFRGLARRLAEDLSCKVLIIGREDELDKDMNNFRGIADNIIDLTGRTSLRELGALLKRCKLLISGDSGPVHLACCVGTPVIAIFRNDIPAKGPVRWGPWGDGHIVVEKNNLCDISIDEVFSKAKERLKNK